MKKLLVLLLISFLLVSCALFPEDDKKEKSSTGSMVIEIPEISRSVLTQISDYTVIIKSTALEYSHTMTTTPGNSITLDKLLPGEYTIDVIGTDSSKIEIVNGTANAIVKVKETTSVKIELIYSKGDLSIDLILPSDGTQTPSAPRRVKRNGNDTFTYNENGVITQIDHKSPWSEKREIFKLENGLKRIGSEVFIKQNWESDFSLKYYSEIVNESINNGSEHREKSFKYYINDTKEEYFDYIIDYTIQGRTETRYSYNKDLNNNLIRKIHSINMFDTQDRMTSEEHFYVGSFWTWWFGYDLKEGNPVKATYTYFQNTWRRTSEKIYVNNSLVADTNVVVKEPGIYQYGTTKDSNGFVVFEFHYSDLMIYEDKYIQSITISKSGDIPSNIPYRTELNNSGDPEIQVDDVRVWTEIYNKQFEGIGTMNYPLEFEEGAQASGQILITNVF